MTAANLPPSHNNNNSNNNCDTPSPPILVSTLLFDIDDTLYDVGTGFTAHRNGWGAQNFMVEHLHFPSYEVAKQLRDEYFARYHSTAKALTIAEQEGKFPPLPPGAKLSSSQSHTKRFDPRDLAEWWAHKLDFSLLRAANNSKTSQEEEDEYNKLRQILSTCPLQLIAFSNSPRKYALRVLKELKLDTYFPPEKVFAVDDTLPYCKPETEAFQKVLDAIGVKDPSQCVLIEDSMKNIRVAKSLGMKTVLVVGRGRLRPNHGDESAQSVEAAEAAELTKPGDAPNVADSAVDICIEHCGELKDVLPDLWEVPPKFISKPDLN